MTKEISCEYRKEILEELIFREEKSSEVDQPTHKLTQEQISEIIDEVTKAIPERREEIKELIFKKYNNEGHILIIGIQGSGKSTQGIRLAELLGIEHISTGNILRNEVQEKTNLGLEAEGYMNRGELVPDELIISMVKKNIGDSSIAIIDGFPRTLKQLESNPDFAQQAIVLGFSDEDAMRRIFELRGHENRSDDNPKALKKRFAAYHKHTSPVINAFREAGNLTEVPQDYSDPIWLVFDHLIKELLRDKS